MTMTLDPFVARWGLVALSCLGLAIVLVALAWSARRDSPAALPGPFAIPNTHAMLLLLFGAILLSGIIHIPGIDAIEAGFVQAVYRQGPEELQNAVKRVSDAGGFQAMCIVVGVLALLHMCVGRGRSVRFFLIVMLGELMLEGILKPLVYRERPPLKERVFFDSYPSGHTLAATILVGALLCLWRPACRRRWQRVLLWTGAILWPAAVGASRIYLGRHYPSDVLAGILFGAAWVLTCRTLWGVWSVRRLASNTEDAQRLAA
jgi:undecaprenyl-diphosphatase